MVKEIDQPNVKIPKLKEIDELRNAISTRSEYVITFELDNVKQFFDLTEFALKKRTSGNFYFNNLVWQLRFDAERNKVKWLGFYLSCFSESLKELNWSITIEFDLKIICQNSLAKDKVENKKLTFTKKSPSKLQSLAYYLSN